MYMCRK